MSSPPRKARKITQATLAFQLTPKYPKTPKTGSPEPATRPNGCISPSLSTSNPFALASTPIPSIEGDDVDDEKEETDTRNSVLTLARYTFTVLLERPELSGYRLVSAAIEGSAEIRSHGYTYMVLSSDDLT
jgi:hypothetical protein